LSQRNSIQQSTHVTQVRNRHPNATNFPNGSSLLALTLPTVLSGRDIKGAVIAINATNTSFSGLSRNKQIAVLAHEIGHAIGLGHTGVSANLMYYTVVPTRERLGQGDEVVGLGREVRLGLELDERSDAAWANLAMTLLMLERRDAARDAAARSLALDGADAVAQAVMRRLGPARGGRGAGVGG
jgi:hypothetical protein